MSEETVKINLTKLKPWIIGIAIIFLVVLVLILSNNNPTPTGNLIVNNTASEVNSSQENSEIISNTSSDLHHPQTYGDLQKFINPSEISDYYINNVAKYMKNDTMLDLSFIATYFDGSFNYRGGDLLFNDVTYWRTPLEVLRDGMGGDCKNWAVVVESLMKEYNSSIECYMALWTPIDPTQGGHANVICRFDNKVFIYDEGGTKAGASSRSMNKPGNSEDIQNNKVQIGQMISTYHSLYGLPASYVSALINDQNVILFNSKNNEDFINWASS